MFQTQYFYGSILEAIKIHNFLHENLLHEKSCGAVKKKNSVPHFISSFFVNLIISPNRLLYSVVATQSTSYKHPKSETSMCAMYNLTFCRVICADKLSNIPTKLRKHNGMGELPISPPWQRHC